MINNFPCQWLALLDNEARAYLARAIVTAERAIAGGKPILPERENWFAALQQVSPDNVRAVVLGQDPYPTVGNAMGLAFSVPRGVALPASLRNIYRELANDLGIAPAAHGDLRAWAAQGVLLLNSVLTVETGKPNTHAELGWREVTDAVISAIGSARSSHKAFLLWGAHAQKKAPLIDAKHLVLTAPHPSPLSAHRGFFDCKHFSKTNTFLEHHGLAKIDWKLPA